MIFTTQLANLQVQCWDLGVLRDSLHLQKLRESQVLARGHGLSAAAGGEPHWTNDGIVEVTSAEQVGLVATTDSPARVNEHSTAFIGGSPVCA